MTMKSSRASRTDSLPEDWNESWKGAFYRSGNPAGEQACLNRARYIWKTLNEFDFEPTSFLDLGCGDGTVVKYLLQLYPHSTAALVDWADEALSLAEKTLEAERGRVSFLKGDSNTPHLYQEHAGGTVLSMGVIEHFASPKDLVREIADIMRPGAVLVLMTPNRRSFVGLSRIVLQLTGKWTLGFQREYSVRALEDFCTSAGLEILKAEALMRARITQDSRLTKCCAGLDRVLAKFMTNAGWYSFVFARKKDARDQ